jgi:hypothetical protein
MAEVIQKNLTIVGYATGSIANSANAAFSSLTFKNLATTTTTLAALMGLQAGAKFALIRTDQILSYAHSGQTPTGYTGNGTLGFKMVADTPVWVDVADLASLKFANASGSTAYLYAELYA